MIQEHKLTKTEYLSAFETWVSVFSKASADDPDYELERKLVFRSNWSYIREGINRDKVLDHFNDDPRAPNEFCDAIFKWARHPDKGLDTAFWKNWYTVELAVIKSCLLLRLIYCGEQLRTTPCPKHKGRWSGCAWDPGFCECLSGVNITGWLPNDGDDRAKQNAPSDEDLARYKMSLENSK